MLKTKHNLDFEMAEWPLNTEKKDRWVQFRIGLCFGLWRPFGDAYQILAIENSKPNNGHLEDVFQWFEFSCKRDNMNLQVLELWNDRFKKHLIEKRGFEEFQQGECFGVIKRFKKEVRKG